MIRFGKTAQTAIAAMSLLAEVYDGGKTKLSSQEIAERRGLPQPVVAKVLTILSSLGLVDGTRGPGGGYWLKRTPDKISLLDIVEEFERSDAQIMCPFGPNWCGHGAPCPMHDSLLRMDQQWMTYMRETTLSVFYQKAAKSVG
ncbi:MAG: Rrf2 family transcriptional regulator [Opitutus sp.]|nr:Rrf2 family transcriptional regulator [Opitutus sp.]MCS6246514.1 Rrf2 family transcriptional regulator [Opitutus sp.]MCS6274884.1 Rrf2 family transcriptional regulator [Opitutus sp.]MCS6278070.1 Rrf2 family transcriptional regulator [Opitutus sp.]MCS6298822.1 Rrf2 family transcriptional regulator [Opitutus sp.]